MRVSMFGLLLVSLSGCGRVGGEPVETVDAAAEPAPDAAPDAPPPLVVLDRNCGEVKARLATTTDGVHWIDPDLDAAERTPFQVFCGAMSSPAPVEYLELARISQPADPPGSNYSTYVTGFGCPCGTSTMMYSKIRIDPATLTLAIATPYAVYSATTDLECFRANAGSCTSQPFHWYGTAGSCVDANDASGRANIDLRGTPFHVASTPDPPFAALEAPYGYMSAGAFAIDDARKVVSLSGGGGCGGFGTSTGVAAAQDR